VSRLQKNFVAFAGDCKELQNGKSQTRDWFMQIVNHANNKELQDQMKPGKNGDGNTAQGFYIIGADGKLYGFMNSHYIPEVVKFMDQGIAEFKKNPPTKATITQEQLKDRFAHTPDATTAVVQVFTRIKPLPAGCDELNKSVGRDYLWVFPDDVQQLVAASEGDTTFKMPKPLVSRLVRYHLNDNVRGEPDHAWDGREVKSADFKARLVGEKNGVKHFEFEGSYKQEGGTPKHGQQGTLAGMFDIEVAKNRLTNFRAFGQAEAWGRSRFTPGEPKGAFTLVTAMVDAKDEASRIVQPHALWDLEGYHHPD
jgi:hypothetical protein